MRYSQFTNRIAGEGAAAWNLHYEAVKAKRAGADVIVLSIGDPDFDSPAEVTAAAIAALKAGDTHYSDVLGLPDLRATVARYHSRTTGQIVGPENVAIVAGAQGGLFSSSVCMLDESCEAIVFEPMYVTYEATIQASGAHLVRVQMRAENDFRLDPRDLEAAISPRTRAIIFATPNNPTGVVMDQARLEAIAALAIKNDLWVISDEVYGQITFGAPHLSIAAMPGMAERTVTINSLSKSHAMTGWRSGWMVGPSKLIEHVGNLGLCMLYGSPPFIQRAAQAALESDIPDVSRMRDAYRRRRDTVVEVLNQVPGLSCHVPEAGMFMMLDVRGIGLSAGDFAWQLFRKTGVAVLDATAFGQSAVGHVRLSFAIDEASLAEACRRIRDFVATLPSKSGETLSVMLG